VGRVKSIERGAGIEAETEPEPEPDPEPDPEPEPETETETESETETEAETESETETESEAETRPRSSSSLPRAGDGAASSRGARRTAGADMGPVLVVRQRLRDPSVEFRYAAGDLGVPRLNGVEVGVIEAAEQLEGEAGALLTRQAHDLGERRGHARILAGIERGRAAAKGHRGPSRTAAGCPTAATSARDPSTAAPARTWGGHRSAVIA
jgi:hypothetical protein